MQYQVIHTTEYKYNQTVSLCHNIARLLMRDTEGQHCKNTEVTFFPQPDVVNEYEDFFGNKVMYFAIQQEHSTLKVTVKSLVQKRTDVNLTMNLYGSMSWEETKRLIMQQTDENYAARQFIPYTDITSPPPEIIDYALQSFTPERPVFDATHDLMYRIHKDFKYDPDYTTVATPLHEVMKGRKGVCQDFAHLAISCLRSVGLPARYISGYLETFAPQGKEKLVGADASHAWFAVFIPQYGWMEFDPTNNLIPGDHHLIIGWGRDYADVPPLKGVIFSSGKHQLKVSVDVRRIN